MKAIERYCAQPKPVIERKTNAIPMPFRSGVTSARSAPKTTIMVTEAVRVHFQWPILLPKTVRRAAPKQRPVRYMS